MEAVPAVIRELSQVIGSYDRKGGGEEFLFKCTFRWCDDRKQHLSVNPFKQARDGSKGVYRCWKCGSKGPLDYLRKYAGIAVDTGTTYDATEYDEMMARLRGDIPPPVKLGRIDYALAAGTDYWPTIPPYTEAWRYLLQDRKMDPALLTRHQFGLGMGEYRNRIIIPEMEEDRMVFWQARSYTGRRPKYVSPTGERDFHIWNFSRVRDLYDEVRITEGVFSGLACNEEGVAEGVATYSYNYLPGQVSLLTAAEFKRYVIIFDGQLKAYEAADKLVYDLMAEGVPEEIIYIVPLPLGYDPDDMGQVRMRYYIANAIRWSPVWIQTYITGGELCPDVITSANCQNGPEL